MKLRIKGNSLRFRVSRSELARLRDGDRLEETIYFSTAPHSHLTYGLQSSQQSKPVAIQSAPQTVRVLISAGRIETWSRETEVGIYESIDLGSRGSLVVVIEKDFACLDRSDKENADTFANPSAAALCR